MQQLSLISRVSTRSSHNPFKILKLTLGLALTGENERGPIKSGYDSIHLGNIPDNPPKSMQDLQKSQV